MPSIQNVRAVGNPQRSYEFEVEILGASVSGSLPLLTERVKNVSIPEKTIETIEINYKSRKAMYAGRDGSSHTVIVTFWDDETHAAYNFINNWMENGLSDSEVGGGVTRDAYSAEMLIKYLAHDSTTVTSTAVLTHVFPITLGDVQLSYDTSDHKTFDVTFSFDSHIME